MKIIIIIFTLLASFFIFALPSQNVNDYIVYQDNQEQKVPVYNGVINLNRAPFSFRFTNKEYDWEVKRPYAVHLSVLKNKAEWEKIESGGEVEKSLFFNGGAVFAFTQKRTYGALFFSDKDKDYIGGNHLLAYEKANLTAVNLLESYGDYYRLEFNVDNFFIDTEFVKITDSVLSKFYVAIFNDSNLDKIIDEDELTKFIIRFNGPS